jgi:hypothetical protein
MPLDAEAEAVTGVFFDTLDDTVLGDGIDDETRPRGLDRLVMGAVDAERIASRDAMEERPRDHPDRIRGLVARVRLAVRQAIRDFVWNVLDQGPAERNIQELPAAADPEHRHFPGEGAFRGGELELVRQSLVVTLGCRVAAPNSAGSTSKPPPVTISPSVWSR